MPLNVTSDAVTGTDATQYVETMEDCTTLSPIAPNGTCSIKVQFAPSSRGTRNAQVHIVSNALTSPDDLALSGTGIQSVLSPTPGSKVFAGQRVGTASGAQTFTITNTGTDTLNVTTAALAGTDAGQYVESNDHCSGHAVAPTHTCTVDVAFKPSSLGAHTARRWISRATRPRASIISL